MLKNYIVVPKNYVIVIIIINIKKVRTFEKKSCDFLNDVISGEKVGIFEKSCDFLNDVIFGEKVGIFRNMHTIHDHVDSA